MVVTIRTKRPAQYLHGEIGYHCAPFVGKRWVMIIHSLAGGGRKVSIGKAGEYRCKTKKELIKKLKSFARSQRYIILFGRWAD